MRRVAGDDANADEGLVDLDDDGDVGGTEVDGVHRSATGGPSQDINVHSTTFTSNAVNDNDTWSEENIIGSL